MNSLPRITVVTPSFNQGRFIERTIRSVLEQGYDNLEYMVLDGGSEDETLEILERYGERIIWRSEKDRGQVDAINKGLSMATGEIVGFLNSDDMYEKGVLHKVAAHFSDHPGVMWLTGRCRIIDEHDREVRRAITWYKNTLLEHYSYGLLLVTNFISQPATFWRKEVVEEFGLLDPDWGNVMDYEYWLRIGRKYPPLVLRDYLAMFRVHPASKTSSGFLDSFGQELEVCKRYSKSRAIRMLHCLSSMSICAIYTLMHAAKGR